MSSITSTLPAAPLRSPENDAAWRQLVEAAGRPYRAAGPFSLGFARGKLRHDPVFRHLLERGGLSLRPRVVDIGCGQGLLCSLLAASQQAASTGRWPAAWAAAPRLEAYTGIELMARDVARAEHALRHEPRARFVCADMREAALPACDAVVILDVLHYVPLDDQQALLRRVRDALSPGGRLLLRVGDRSQSRGYAISQWVDHVVTRVRGHRVPPTWGRSVAEWTALLQSLDFQVQTLPMSRGTPFANVLLLADAAGQPFDASP